MNEEIIARAGEIIAQNTGEAGYCVLRFKTERYNLFVDWKEATGAL